MLRPCCYTKRKSYSCAVLIRRNKAETAVHGCWLLSSILLFIYLTQGIMGIGNSTGTLANMSTT